MPDAFNAFQPGRGNTLGSGLNPFSPPRPAPPPMPAAEEQLPSHEELVAKAERESAPQRQLEEENSRIGTMALQAARGALDAVLAPGALLGAEWEGIGSILRIDPLEKLGRELGKASSGKSAMEALGFVAKGGGQVGLKTTEKVAQKIEDQEKAWPMLSLASRVAGNAALVLASGAGSATGGAKAMLAMGAAEGAGGGAQAAYEEAAPLTDVLTSAMLGSAIGLAATGVGVGAGAAAKRLTAKVSAEGAEALAPEALEKMAAKSAFKATVDRQTEINKVIGKLSPEAAEDKVIRIGKEILDSESLEDAARWHGIRKADELPNVLWAKKEDAGAALGQMRRELDQEIGSGGSDVKGLLQKIRSDVVDPLQREASQGFTRSEATRDLRAVARTLQNIGDRLNLTEQAEAAASRDAASFIDDMGLGSDKIRYLREGMRDELGHPGAYKGATPEQVDAIARGELGSMDTGQKFEPVHLVVEYEPGKPPDVFMQDGRHRLVAARNAGAKEVLADVEIRRIDPTDKFGYVDEGVITRPIPIAPAPPQAAVSKKIPIGSPRWWDAVDQMPDGQVKVGFGELEAMRKQLADRVYIKPPRGGITPPPPRSMLTLQRIERNIARHIDEDAESALERLGRDKSQYVRAKQRYAALRTAYDGSKKKADAILGNRNFSITDYGVGIGALASGGAPGAIAALPMTLANKWLRENGRALTAVTLRRTARALQGEVQGGVGLFARGIGLAHKTAVKVPKYLPNVAREIGREAATEHERWRNREKALQRMVQSDQGITIAEALRQMPGIPAGLTTALSQLGGSRVRQLLNDLPKLRQDFRGPAYQRLSRSDVKLANAMYEATFDPLSIFEDYKNGEVNYSKVQYVWKIYPGFQRYCQAAVVDMLSQQMTDEERAAIPDSSLTQMDFFFGFNGSLQPTLNAEFSRKFTAIGAQQEANEQSQLKAPLKLPTTKRTMAQRMARQ